MIKQTTITRAIKSHLETMSRPLTFWENQDAQMPKPPFIVVESIRNEPQAVGWCGNLNRYAGRVQAAIVVNNGAGVGYSETLAEEIAAHFTGEDITADGVVFTITEQPFIGNGYNDAALYRMPVQIRYSFLA